MIDTAVEGEVGSVTRAATWLRETLSANLTTAADDCARGRSVAGREWEGTDATAYSDYARRVLSLTDEHAARVGRAANAFDAYGARLSTMKSTMRGFRARAVAGGLQVSGDLIAVPPAVPATVVQPGSTEETEHQLAVAKVDLYNTLSDETTTARTEFDLWIQANLVPEVSDAADSTPVDTLGSELQGVFPNYVTGVAAGLTGVGLKSVSSRFLDAAREVRRKSRVSRDPRVRGKGGPKSNDLLGKAKWFGKAGRILGGPIVGVGIEIVFGIKEARETGDWKRAAITTGTSIAVGTGVALGAAALLVTAPAWVTVGVVVVGAGAVAAGSAWVAGKVYDNWDDITGWTGDRWDDTKSLAGDALDGARDFADGTKDKIGGALDAVTPW